MIAGTINKSKQLHHLRKVLKNNGLNDEQVLIAHELVSGCFSSGSNLNWVLQWEKTNYLFKLEDIYRKEQLSKKLIEGLIKETETQIIFGSKQTTAVFKV